MNPSILSIAAAACAALVPSLAAAEDIYVGSYGGSVETTFKQRIIPAFEKMTGDKIVYVAGNSTDTLAKLQAEKNNPQFDVALIDDGPMEQAVQFGFCAPIEDAPVYKDLYPIARIGGGKALAFGAVATGLFYNEAAFKKAGWAPPDSWENLTDKKYAGKVVIPPISNGYGLQTLLKFAELRGGGASKIDPGFDALIKQVSPNVLAWEPSPGKMTELFQNGDAVIGVWGSGRVKALQDTGFPVKFVYPKEGAYVLFTAVCPVAKAKPKPGAQKFVQYLFSPEVQTAMAEGQAYGPLNSKVVLKPEVAAQVPYGPAQIAKLQTVDYKIVNAKRAEWTNRWNRSVER